MMDLSILIISWNTAQFLRKCLESIQLTSQDLNIETIVIENASTDGSLELIQDEFTWVRPIPCQENLGFGRGNNLGVQITQGRNLLLLNPDTIVHPGALHSLLDHLEMHPKVGAVGPRILNPDGTLQVSISPSPSLFRETWRLFHLDFMYPFSKYPQKILASTTPQPVDVLLGACVLIRKSIVDQIGLFDEQFFMYSEEVDLCKRIQEAGWRIEWLPSAHVTHYGGQSTNQVAEAMFLELYRNKVRFFRKHRGSLYSKIYKVILFIAALARWIPGDFLGRTQRGRHAGWSALSHQYRRLISELHSF